MNKKMIGLSLIAFGELLQEISIILDKAAEKKAAAAAEEKSKI